jgi:hypothetical protein
MEEAIKSFLYDFFESVYGGCASDLKRLLYLYVFSDEERNNEIRRCSS